MKKKRPRIKLASFIASSNNYEKKIKEKLYDNAINSIFEKENKINKYES